MKKFSDGNLVKSKHLEGNYGMGEIADIKKASKAGFFVFERGLYT